MRKIAERWSVPGGRPKVSNCKLSGPMATSAAAGARQILKTGLIVAWLGLVGGKYPPAEAGAFGLEPREAAGPCCINPHSYSHCAMPPQEPSVLLGHPYLTFW